MTIKEIEVILNPNAKKMKPIKEKQDILIPDIIDENIPNRNGFIYVLCGSAGSGKTNLLINSYKNKNMYPNISQNYINPYIINFKNFICI